MIDFIITLLLTAAAFYFGAKLLSGVDIKNYPAALIMALVVAIINATLGAVLDWITFSWLSLIVNTITIMIADYLISSVKIKNFIWAFFLAIFVSLVGWLTSGLLGRELFFQ